ncbi:hypothetical protein ACHAXS_004232 [Conticribra weissflogii]
MIFWIPKTKTTHPTILESTSINIKMVPANLPRKFSLKPYSRMWDKSLHAKRSQSNSCNPTKDLEVILFKVNPQEGYECYKDADFTEADQYQFPSKILLLPNCALDVKDSINCACYPIKSCNPRAGKITQDAPRIKHITVFFHHFCEHVCQEKIKRIQIHTNLQLADMATNAFPKDYLQVERECWNMRYPMYLCISTRTLLANLLHFLE